MIRELGEYDLLRSEYDILLLQLDSCRKSNFKMNQYYKDSLMNLNNELLHQKEFAQLQTDNLNNAEAQLFNKKTGTDSLRKQRNAWRIIAGAAIVIATIINVSND